MPKTEDKHNEFEEFYLHDAKCESSDIDKQTKECIKRSVQERKLKKLLGIGLILASVYFNWVLVLSVVIGAYGLITGSGSGLDIAGDGILHLAVGRIIPGLALLGGGIYILKWFKM